MNKRPARMCLLAVPELVPMEVSVNEDLTITFQEEMMRCASASGSGADSM